MKEMDSKTRAAAEKRIQDNADFYVNHLKIMTDEYNISEIAIDSSSLENGSEFW